VVIVGDRVWGIGDRGFPSSQWGSGSGKTCLTLSPPVCLHIPISTRIHRSPCFCAAAFSLPFAPRFPFPLPSCHPKIGHSTGTTWSLAEIRILSHFTQNTLLFALFCMFTLVLTLTMISTHKKIQRYGERERVKEVLSQQMRKY